MPVFKGKGCKSTAAKAISYITNPDKAEIVSSQAMDDNRDYAEQFRDTGKLYGKGEGFDERKYYHFTFSCDPADRVTAEQSHKMAEKMAARSFPGHECVIATHTDKDHVHSHIIVNAVNFEDGKKLQINNQQYCQMKDRANEIAQEHGCNPLDWRTTAKEKRQRTGRESIPDKRNYSQSEKYMQQQHSREWSKKSWKENLRQVIDEAKATCTTRQELQSYLKKNYSVEMPRNTEKSVSFVHPAVTNKAVRGVSLGADYTTASIDQALRRNSERRSQNAKLHATKGRAGTGGIDPNRTVGNDKRPKQVEIPNQPIGTSFSEIERELRSIDESVELLTTKGRGELAGRAEAERSASTEVSGASKLAENSERTVEREPKQRVISFDHNR